MSIEQAQAFRTFVNENESVQHKIREATCQENWNVPSLAVEHGYTFTAQEAQSAWDLEKEGELTDFELEVVGCSGGKHDAGAEKKEKQADGSEKNEVAPGGGGGGAPPMPTYP